MSFIKSSLEAREEDSRLSFLERTITSDRDETRSIKEKRKLGMKWKTYFCNSSLHAVSPDVVALTTSIDTWESALRSPDNAIPSPKWIFPDPEELGESVLDGDVSISSPSFHSRATTKSRSNINTRETHNRGGIFSPSIHLSIYLSIIHMIPRRTWVGD